jgi:hypothetical protein
MLAFLGHWLGLDNASGPQYLWWSGFFADITIFAAGWSIVRHKNCHEPWCPRVGKFGHVDGDGQRWQYCKRHHPDDKPGVQ